MRVLAVVGLVVLLAGCGGGGTKNDPKSVADAFAKAVSNGDWSKACSLMTSEAKAQILVAGALGGKAGGGCEDALKSVMGLLDPADRDALEKAHVTEIKIQADTATVRYSSDGPDDSPTHLVNKGGHWLIDKDPDTAASDGAIGGDDLSADSDAKSNARNMVSQVESCYSDAQDYSRCMNASDLGDTGLDIGSGAGQVEVTRADETTYEIAAHSESGHTFSIKKQPDGTIERTCNPEGEGSCQADGTW